MYLEMVPRAHLHTGYIGRAWTWSFRVQSDPVSSLCRLPRLAFALSLFIRRSRAYTSSPGSFQWASARNICCCLRDNKKRKSISWFRRVNEEMANRWWQWSACCFHLAGCGFVNMFDRILIQFVLCIITSCALRSWYNNSLLAIITIHWRKINEFFQRTKEPATFCSHS